MTKQIPDLWPKDLAVNVLSPAAILRHQASQLTERTSGLLRGDLRISNDRNNIAFYNFFIVAQALDDSELVLFSVWHAGDMVYPASLKFAPWVSAAKDAWRKKNPFGAVPMMSEPEPSGVELVPSPERLLEKLRDLFGHDYTMSVLMSLLARINDTMPDTAIETTEKPAK